MAGGLPRPRPECRPPDRTTIPLTYYGHGCNVCHGDQAEGGIGPPLAGGTHSLTDVWRALRTTHAFLPGARLHPRWSHDPDGQPPAPFALDGTAGQVGGDEIREGGAALKAEVRSLRDELLAELRAQR